jgi:hypothetical protein
VRATRHLGFPAYEITDGRSRAVVVPELGGRVMFWGRVNGPNLMYNVADRTAENLGEGFVNWGGDKTLAGPHVLWRRYSESRWPPRPSWISEAHGARLEDGGRRLVTTGPVWEGFEFRVIRAYRFVGDGVLEITQILEKTNDSEERLAVWSVSQVREPDQVYMLRAAEAGGEEGIHYSNRRREAMPVDLSGGDFLRFTFQSLGAVKVSLETPHHALAARWGDTVWLQRARFVSGNLVPLHELPVFPVEIYSQGRAEANYVELELMSPLVLLKKHEPVIHTLYWSLHPAPAHPEPIKELLRKPPPDPAPNARTFAH